MAKCVKLDGLGRLVMGFDVQDVMFCESFPLNTVVSRKVICCSMYPLTIKPHTTLSNLSSDSLLNDSKSSKP